MLSSWLSDVAQEGVTADARATPVKMTVHAARASIVLGRKFMAQSSSAHARGVVSLRARGRQLAE